MKRFLKAVWDKIMIWHLRSEIKLWDKTITAEIERHENHAEIMRQLYWQRAQHQSKLDRIIGHAAIDYSFGPTMRQR